MKQAPIWVWLTLLVAVFGVSSAGAILQHLDEILLDEGLMEITNYGPITYANGYLAVVEEF